MTDDSDAPTAVFLEEPFHMTFAAQAEEDGMISLACGDVDAVAITSDRVELRYVMHLSASSMQTQPARLITEALPVPSGPTDGSIVLYFTQPGERLWDIARRYRVAEAALRALNPELTDDPKPGQGVVVWRKEA